MEGQVLLGERRWVERMKRRLGEALVAGEVTGRKELRARAPLSVVIPQVCREAKVDKATLLRPRGARGNWARRVAMALGGSCAG